MASAKKEAQKSLGTVEDYINLAGLNKERDLANQMYNTNYNQYTNTYNDLLNTINSNREAARTDFGKGRTAVAENAYLQNRSDLSDLASRGLSGGVAQLSKLGNRIETGRQYSNLANTYYNRMNDLDASQRSGENEYNYNLEMARNNLNSALADVDAREAVGRNNYKAAVAQLAEQIQARRDAAAQAAAYRKALAQSQQSAIKAALIADINAIIDSTGGKVTKDNYNDLIEAYKHRMGGSNADATKWLAANNYGSTGVGTLGPVPLYASPIVTPSPETSTKSSIKSSTKSSTTTKSKISRAHSASAKVAKKK